MTCSKRVVSVCGRLDVVVERLSWRAKRQGLSMMLLTRQAEVCGGIRNRDRRARRHAFDGAFSK